MSSIGTLWTYPEQERGRIIRAAAAFGGLSVDIPADYKHFEDNKKPEYLSKFPAGKIPAFESKDGFTLFEGAAIARHVAGLAPNSGLLGADAKEAALVDQWAHYAESEVFGPAIQYYLVVKGIIQPYSKPLQTFFVERANKGLQLLEDHLATRTFFVGERITLADLSVAAYVGRAGTFLLGAEERSKFPNVFRHLDTIANQSSTKDIFLPLNLVDKPLQFTPPAKEKKDAKPAAAPKAEKKPKAKAADDDDDEPLVPAEAKAKNPLDELPPSSMTFDAWKRAYSNMETRGAGGAIEWFYQNFDAQGYSVWRMDFKYNEELTQTFMSSNQITGFFNRLEANRKHLFASVGVLGEANNNMITGIIIVRGQDAKTAVECAPDWESYEFTKLDIADAAQKEFFEAALAWDLEVDGKKWVDGKNFK
ncbi:elongation factor 1-gamma [Pterulicium gracile]|uniref:Elongation factor 1-gamma n=1 Tax=Pterulicium gracile TaxID=1884261 RepID=A0A5C3Q6V1_9AGAR|nr:elongation factor 1-gamma [Pterula gracilis]